MKKLMIFISALFLFDSTEAFTTIVNDTIQFSGVYPKVAWQTTSELNNEYFKVMRSYDSLNWVQAKRVKGAGTSSTVISYSFVDSGFVQTGAKVYYQLCTTDITHMEYCSAPISYNFSTGVFSTTTPPKLDFTASYITEKKSLKIAMQNYRAGKFYEIEITDPKGNREYLKPFSGSEGVIDVSTLLNKSHVINLWIDKKLYVSKKIQF